MIAEIRTAPSGTTKTNRPTAQRPRWRAGKLPATRGRRPRTGARGFRLGIISGVNGAWHTDGRLYVRAGEGRLINALLARFPDARLCVPVCAAMEPSFQQPLNVERANVEPLPPLRSTIKAQKHFFTVRRAVRRFAKTVDVLYIKADFTVPRVLKGLGKPKLLHVVGDTREVVRVSSDYRGVWRLLARAAALDIERTLKKLVAEPATRVATHGSELWDKLGCQQGRVVVSSSILEHEMQPERRPLGDPPRIMFVGYLRPEKGVPYLLEAFHQIRSRRPIKLTLVGGLDRASRAEQEIRERIENSPYRDDIELTGTLAFGKPLFDAYRTHDLCVQPSLSEGTPRTLIEARAFGCPVVATRVGGIPASVRDGHDGLLVEPRDAQGLALAIERILDDRPLRRRLIDEGIRTAKANSLDRFADKLADELELLGREHVAPARPHAAPARLEREPALAGLGLEPAASL